MADAGDTLLIGARTTHYQLINDPLVAGHCGLLAQAARTVADPAVRHRGTLGGALAHADPAGDLPAVALALDATLIARGPGGEREIAAGDFFAGYLTTTLRAGEILTAIRVPKLGPGWGYRYEKFHRTAQAWATVGVAALARRSNGTVAEARIALTNMGQVPVRARAAENAAAGARASREALRAAAASADEGTQPPGDLNGAPDYRRHLARVLTGRALAAAAGVEEGPVIVFICSASGRRWAGSIPSAFMTGYRQVSDEIAERVARGALAPGDRLPSVRDVAQQYSTTTGTAARAYRRLADAGVIDSSDRRRSRVASGGALAARRLAGQPAGGGLLRLGGSDDPALDIVLGEAGQGHVVTVGERGSFHGLTGLWRGSADAAAIHLRHHCGEHNSPFARTLLRGRHPALIHVWRREQGLIAPRASTDGAAGIAGLRGLRVARRRFGTGTRVLLDRLLDDAGISPAGITGPEAGSHLEVAMSIAAGQADAGLGVRAAATLLGLDFTPVTWEDFDIALPSDALGAAEPLIAALRQASVRSAVEALGGYDLSRSGTVLLLD